MHFSARLSLVCTVAATLGLVAGGPSESVPTTRILELPLMYGGYRLPPFLVPSQFCRGLPAGQFCNVASPREMITCPTSVSTLCPLDSICRENPLTDAGRGKYTASCQPKKNPQAAVICANISLNQTVAESISRCLDKRRVILCPESTTVYECAPDLVCQSRGLRAYCVSQAVSSTSPDMINSCAGFPATQNPPQTICDAINLRRVLQCPTQTSYQCPMGTLCTAISPSQAGCVPWTEDLLRFCSNKPLYSTHCIPQDKHNRLIQCGPTPEVLACPYGKRNCIQALSITAKCV